MKDTKTKIDNARVLGFIGGIVFANAVHAAIVLPAVALRLGAKGKHNLHRAHHPHEATGPVHFLAEQAKDEHALLADIKEDLDEIKKKLHEPGPEPPKPDKGPEPPAPEPPKPDEGPEGPKPEDGPKPPEPGEEDGPKPPEIG